jgi:hypothetical protein
MAAAMLWKVEKSFAPLAAALKQRAARVREFIAHDQSRYDGFPAMFDDLSQALTDGRGGGSRMLSGPFKWDVDMIWRRNAPTPAGVCRRSTKTDSLPPSLRGAGCENVRQLPFPVPRV